MSRSRLQNRAIEELDEALTCMRYASIALKKLWELDPEDSAVQEMRRKLDKARCLVAQVIGTMEEDSNA